MDIISIINKLLPILPVALITAFFIIGISFVSYVFYKKRGGKLKVTITQFVSIFLLLGWFVVVMVLTTFSRGEMFEGLVNFRLFSDYVNTWHQWSLSELQLIIFNMLMFAPLGFLLPLLSKKLRHFGIVLGVSFFVTLGIEFIQMVTHRGIFELNDILHNVLGSVAGYLLMSAILDCVTRRKIIVKSVLKALYIPMFFVLLFSCALIVYHTKELGNLSIRPAVPQNMKQVDVKLKIDLPTDTESVSLYRNKQIHNLKYGKEIAARMEKSFNLQQKGRMRIEGFNRIWTYIDKDGKEFTFTYSLQRGGWGLYHEGDNNDPMKPDRLEKYGQYYGKKLVSTDVLPPDAVFSTQDENTLRWDIEQNMTDIIHGDSDFTEGFIMLIPSQKHQIPLDLDYDMNENKYVRKVDIISPAQAYKDILKGNFAIYNDLVDGDQLDINEYELDYIYDSKGYYQPVYRFKGLLNGEAWEVLIPAIQ
ncbi:VanZ family protein [Rummeliibacillus sp. POC4]|uniref:VanZ family protein n=1 Tax=Rummeliibacillus sp. POC4 TaxID=2305899 RepID=UPI000E6682C9|nr:VanZ family protein [Rummeliibacillus sp. POC4]RIJ66204.1 VanZ family protein [Rummeliibacillus sp. POC4]